MCASHLPRQTTKWLAYGCHTSVFLFDWCILFLVLFQLCDVPQTLNIQHFPVLAFKWELLYSLLICGRRRSSCCCIFHGSLGQNNRCCVRVRWKAALDLYLWASMFSKSRASLARLSTSFLLSLSCGRLRCAQYPLIILITYHIYDICFVDLGHDTRTSTQSCRLVRRKDASWSLNWPFGANLLAHKQNKYI
jgi:hypothetical protein